MNYIFFYTVTSNTLLLKEWVKLKFPRWNLSFSSEGWITYKTNIHDLPVNFPEFHCPLALRWGMGLDIVKTSHSLNSLLETIKKYDSQLDFNHIHYYEKKEIESENLLVPSTLIQSFKEKLINKPLSYKDACLQIFKFKEQHYALGLSFTCKGQSIYSGADPKIVLPMNCPSKAYLKIAQICSVFKIDFSAKDHILELGSFPGGITTYLLEKFSHVYSVDSAAMKIKHPNLRSLVCSVQHLDEKDLPPLTNWIVSDLNLSPKQMLNEVIRLGKKIKSLRGLILTLKLPKTESVRHLDHYLNLMKKEFPQFEFSLFQVPSHGKETHLVGI